MIRYGKKKHFGFWCNCPMCGDRDKDERRTMKKRARRKAKRDIRETQLEDAS
jgi:hypothetical protein